MRKLGEQPKARRSVQEILECLGQAIEETPPDMEEFYRQQGFGCDQCDGYGNIITASGARPCDCKKKYFTKQRMGRIAVPEAMVRMSLGNYRINGNTEREKNMEEEILECARRYVNQFKGDKPLNEIYSLFINSIGKAGVGKTHIAVGILREVVSLGNDGLFIPYLDGPRSLVQTTFDCLKDGTTPYFLTKEVLDTSLMVIDDLGTGRTDVVQVVRENVARLVRARYNNAKPMIITTNMGIPDVELLFGLAISSRLNDEKMVQLDMSNMGDKRGQKTMRRRVG